MTYNEKVINTEIWTFEIMEDMYNVEIWSNYHKV